MALLGSLVVSASAARVRRGAKVGSVVVTASAS
jgi:hypothetical protein